VSITVSILNRQRSQPIDRHWLDETVDRLARAILINIKERVPPHIPRSFIDALNEDAAVSLVLVSNRTIRQLNKQWRGKDEATDVLSFPLLEDGQDEICPATVNGQPMDVGEIFISVDKTRAQAAEYGHTFERELSFLFVHGFLHLLGFDHITKEEELEMFGRQREILEVSGFSR